MGLVGRRQDKYTGAAHVNRDKVLQGFAHLQTLDMQMTCVKEVIHPCRALMVRLDDRITDPSMEVRHEKFEGMPECLK